MSGFEINEVVLSGNLTADPELRSLPSGTSVCNLRIAHNARRKTSGGDWEDETYYFNITVWTGIGEWVSKNMRKGDKIVVSGQLKWREWEDRDGNKRQAVDVTAQSVVPVPKGERSNGSGSGFAARDEVPVDLGQPAAAAAPASTAVDDDIPF